MSDFTPAIWTPSSRVTMCRVSWDSAYRDLVGFESREARAAYFAALDNEPITIDRMTYLKPNEPIAVNVPYSRAYNYNYVVVENQELPVEGEATPPVLYYFITSAAFVAPNTTYLTLELDCWQTYMFDIDFGRSFVTRGHIGMQAAHNSMADQVTPQALSKYLTAAEGLDIGNDYQIARVEHCDLSARLGGELLVVIMSTQDLTGDWGTLTEPNLDTAIGQLSDGLISGCSLYAMQTNLFVAFMEQLSRYPWIGKGILSLTVFPSWLVELGDEVLIGGSVKVGANLISSTPDQKTFWQSGDLFQGITNGIPQRYRHLRKFCTFPYSVIEMTNYTSANVLLKPQLLGSPNLSLSSVSCAVPPHMRLAVYPVDYGHTWVGDNTGAAYDYVTMQPFETYKGDIPLAYYTDVAVWFSDFPQFSIVTDGFLTYMASTTHGRAYSYEAAGWSLAKTNAGTSLGLGQANATLANNQANQDISNIATLAHLGINGVGSLLQGNVGGALGGTLNGGVDLIAGNMQFQNNQALQGGFASQNAELANWAAQGDYQNQIAAINATVQDAALTQPSIAGQAGGDGFNLANGLFGCSVRCKTLDYDHAAIVGEYWMRYGYAVQRFVKPPKNMQCMTKFTYWKMSETYLTSAKADEGAKNVIRGIFERGCTVWADPTYIGVIDVSDNLPITGVIPY